MSFVPTAPALPAMHRPAPHAKHAPGMKPAPRPSLLDRITLVQLALAISIGAHAMLLTLHFVVPDSLRFKQTENTLEVILVNAKSPTPPAHETALAQANLNGGGLYEKGQVQSFLPRMAASKDGEALQETQAAATPPEAEQKRLLEVNQSARAIAEPSPSKNIETPNTSLDLNESIRSVARMEAQISKRIEDYSERPRRGFISPSTRSISYAMYYNQWKEKIERVGTINYPEEARGRLYGDLILTVTLKHDGTIYNDQIDITKSSGSPVLDRAAKRIVRLAAPYGQFSAEMRKEYDIFEITTKFSFTRSDGFEANIQK